MPADRLQRRADELYARAGYDNEDGTYIHKHKWMRWQTFDRLVDRANQVSREADIAALAGLARLGFFSWDDSYASRPGRFRHRHNRRRRMREIADMAALIVSPETSFTTGFTFDLSGGRATY